MNSESACCRIHAWDRTTRLVLWGTTMEREMQGFALRNVLSSSTVYCIYYLIYTGTLPIIHGMPKGGSAMKTKGYLGEAKIFTNGGSQAVRLPAACRFQSSSVTIHKLGRLVILQEPQPSWDEFFARPRLPKAHRLQRGVHRPVDVRRPLR